MGFVGRCVVLCSLTVVLTACGDDGDTGSGAGGGDFREKTPKEICGLVTVAEARDLMKDLADEDDPIDPAEETSVSLPACRYGSEDGKPYLRVSIQQTSKAGGDDPTRTTVAGQEALQQSSDGSCSVFVPLEDNLYLLAIAESWNPEKDACPAARGAVEKAYPRLTS
jgi:hypothetical protein